MISTIRIGTRQSKLALWQTQKVANLLHQAGMNSEIDKMETIGDKVLDTSIAKIGSKGVFTVELEEKLATGINDIAVHSAKDMQSLLPKGFEIIAFTKRERAHDVLLSSHNNKDFDIESKKNLVVGTSSVRRRAFLQHHYPHLKLVEMRGNLQTRIAKMERGDCDALMLAYAGVVRMGYEQMIVREFSTQHFTPPVGQGCIAIEAATSLKKSVKEAIRAAVNDVQSEICLSAERAFLKKMEGGCSIPAFGYAELKGNIVQMQAGLASLDGLQIIEKKGNIRIDLQHSPHLFNIKNAQQLGEELAEAVLASGGKKVLAAIKKKQN